MTNSYAPKRRFKALQLSEEAQEVLRAGVRGNWSYADMQREVRELTGEAISEAAICRWAQCERAAQRIAEAQAYGEIIVAGVTADPDGRFAKAIGHRFEELYLNGVMKLEEGDMTLPELQNYWAANQKLQLSHKRAQIAERAVDVEAVKADASMKAAEAAMKAAESRAKALELQAQRVAEGLQKAEQAARKASDGRVDADTLKAIREDVFGMFDAPEVANG